MRRFTISVDGVPPKKVADEFWKEIEQFKVNFMVLDRNCFIYGYTDDETIDLLYEKAKSFGFELDLERGEVK